MIDHIYICNMEHMMLKSIGEGDRNAGVQRVKNILKEPVGEERLTKVVEA